MIKKEEEDPKLKEVIISMNEVNYTIKIKIDIKLDEFKNIVKEKFKINNIISLSYIILMILVQKYLLIMKKNHILKIYMIILYIIKIQ